MRGQRGAPVPFKVRKPVAEVPANGFTSPYDPIFKAVMKLPKGQHLPLECDDFESAKKLQSRLYAAMPGHSLKVPKGSKYLFITPPINKKPTVKVAAKKGKRR